MLERTRLPPATTAAAVSSHEDSIPRIKFSLLRAVNDIPSANFIGRVTCSTFFRIVSEAKLPERYDIVTYRISRVPAAARASGNMDASGLNVRD